MRALGFAIALMAGLTLSGAWAQDAFEQTPFDPTKPNDMQTLEYLGREETLTQVAQTLQALQLDNQRFIQAASASDEETTLGLMEQMIQRVETLRRLLVNNPYIRIGGFSIGLPAGASIDFVFPETP